MVIKAYNQGSLALTEIAAEFGGGIPHSLSEYYAGAGLVPAGTIGYPKPDGTATPIPSPGNPISINNFYGASNYQIVNWYNYGYTTNLNVFNHAIASGITNSASAAQVVVNVYNYGVLGANHVFTYAFDTGSGWARTPIINVYNSGYILGAGGRNDGAYVWWQPRGDGYYNSASNWIYGGHAVILRVGGTTFYNSGWIAGGGGAGGTGQNGIHGGGSGYVTAPGYQTYSSISGPPAGGLITGGGFQGDDGKAGNPNGGAGGGWVAGAYPNSTSNDGWGYGVDGVNNQIYHGGGPPGSAVVTNYQAVNYSPVGSIGGSRADEPYWYFPTYYSPGNPCPPELIYVEPPPPDPGGGGTIGY